MLTLKTTGQFRKDYKTGKKRGLDMRLLETVIDCLISGKELESKYHDHALTGDMPAFVNAIFSRIGF